MECGTPDSGKVNGTADKAIAAISPITMREDEVYHKPQYGMLYRTSRHST